MVLAGARATEQSLYALPLDGGEPKLVVGAADRSVRGSFAHGTSDVFVTAETSFHEPPRFFARTPKGEREIPRAGEGPKRLPRVELTTVGSDRFARGHLRPRGATRHTRLPVIDAAYGGPGYNVVEPDVTRFLWDQWLADATGAAVVFIDARGTPRRGHDWERALARGFGSVPLEGHVKALEALGAKYPALDMTRVGITGWSFGGYLSAYAVLRRPDVYKVGVAGAPVADWRDYDTAYTERYLGLPEEEPPAYDAASVLTAAPQATTRGRSSSSTAPPTTTSTSSIR